jgi:hypothetical protein
MERKKKTIAMFFFLIVLLFNLVGQVESVSAQDGVRSTTIIVPYTEYEWWLIAWSDNTIHCRFYTDHEGLPTIEDVFKFCGEELGTVWLNTPPCKPPADQVFKINECKGLYLHLVSSQSKEREVIIELPPPVVWVDLVGCSPTPPENFCFTIPDLLLIGEEPLPNERIVAIHGTYNGDPFTCEGDTCRLPLRPTSIQGARIEFWADSSYGDSSERYTALVRVIDTGVSTAPVGGGWYIDVISTQWIGGPIATCAGIWESFPSIGSPPIWLTTPRYDQLLASYEPYYYLAGRMINQGLVDVSECAFGGLLPNGYADACGLEKSSVLIERWQNQFDARIVQVAQETGIPAQLLKNLFAQESQFWPGVFRVRYEFGLGQLTDNGADTILLWNDAFFDQYCPLVLTEETCEGGYLHLGDEEQGILRGALAIQANSDCEECPTGIDLNHTEFSVELFARILQASCAQISQTVYNATENMAGEVATYEDLWRFTVANYHAGPGCVAYAIHQAWENTGVLDWEQVSTYFTDPCKGVVPYVDKITQ